MIGDAVAAERNNIVTLHQSTQIRRGYSLPGLTTVKSDVLVTARARLWWADGSCLRRRPEYPNYVWAYDFVMERTWDGRPVKLLTVVDEYTRECLAIAVRRRLTSREVQEVLSELFLRRGCPTHIRSDNGPEFIARACKPGIGC